MNGKSLTILGAAILVPILLVGGCPASPVASFIPSSPPASATVPGETSATVTPEPTLSAVPSQTQASSSVQAAVPAPTVTSDNSIIPHAYG